MFWDRVAGVYDLFTNVYNRKVHTILKQVVTEEIRMTDEVLECACGTGLLTEVIAPECSSIIASDFSANMLNKTRRKCAAFQNVTYLQADILNLAFPDESFDVVVAANVIHLLDEPYKALTELRRVCKCGGKLIIPTYMNKGKNGDASSFSKAVGTAGADFKSQFTFTSYRQFFEDAGFADGTYTMIEGRVPCAVAVIRL